MTYLHGLMPALATASAGQDVSFAIVLSSGYQQDLLAAVPPGVATIPVNIPAEPIWRRTLFQHTTLRAILSTRADLLFSPAEAMYLAPPVPVVMLARNLNMYLPLRELGLPPSRRLRGAVRQRAVRLGLDSADRIAFVSAALRDAAAAQGIHVRESQIIYHGVAPLFFPEPEANRNAAERYLLSVSTISRHKGYRTLITAYSRMPRSSPPMWIAGGIGDRTYYRELLEMIEKLGVADRVRFLGSLTLRELAKLYRGAEAVVFPSERESFGNPLLEAMAAGAPLIVSDLPVFREIAGNAALFVPPGDADSFAASIERVLATPQLRSDLERRGTARAKDFTWEASAAALIDLFRHTLESGRRVRSIGLEPSGAID